VEAAICLAGDRREMADPPMHDRGDGDWPTRRAEDQPIGKLRFLRQMRDFSQARPMRARAVFVQEMHLLERGTLRQHE
jgi:hypothetical protein